jgi:hypothetical protein
MNGSNHEKKKKKKKRKEKKKKKKKMALGGWPNHFFSHMIVSTPTRQILVWRWSRAPFKVVQALFIIIICCHESIVMVS